MYTLMQHLIAFKYACKINHWKTDNFSQHLLFDRLSENIDIWVDSIAECYFMASDNKKVFKPDLLNPKLIDTNLVKMCETIINHLEELQSDDEINKGIESLLGDIEKEILNKMALAKLS